MSQPSSGQPIPTPTSKASSQIPHHWWFDRSQTGILNSSPPSTSFTYPNSPTSSSPPSMSYSPPRYEEDFTRPDPKEDKRFLRMYFGLDF